MSEELLPCPFCGGKAEFDRIGDSRRSTIVSCSECGASQECGEEWGHGRTWNTRRIPEGYALVPVEPTDAMVNVNPRILHPKIAKEIYQTMIAVAQAQQE